MIIYLNGRYCPEQDAQIAVTDRGLTLGDGVFDTMLVHDGVAQDSTAHYERLRHHAAAIGIDFALPDWKGAIKRLLHENTFKTGRHAVRTTVTRGPGARGLALPEPTVPTVIIRAAIAPPVPGPARLIVAQGVRRNEGSPLSRIKSLNYGDNIAAHREAQAMGADDAVMLNNRGDVACATASNLFVKYAGQWLTPPTNDGAMDGIVRARMLRTGKAREHSITPAMLAQAEDLMLTNSINGERGAYFKDADREMIIRNADVR